jgi:hypothetical protein
MAKMPRTELQHPKKKYSRHEKIDNPVVTELQEAGSSCHYTGVECDVVHGAIPVQTNLEPVFVDGELVEIEKFSAGTLVWHKSPAFTYGFGRTPIL